MAGQQQEVVCRPRAEARKRYPDDRDAQQPHPHEQMRAQSSPLAPNGNARHAVDPVNALLNYGYALLEGQVRAALAARGFDPLIGTVHADKPGRDSLVYDAMELRRAAVEDLLLRFVGRHTFRRGDFERQDDGGIRLSAAFARYVCVAYRVVDETLRAGADWLAQRVLD